MMCRLTIFAVRNFALNVIGDLKWYLGNGVRLANKIINYSSCQVVVVFSLSTGNLKIKMLLILPSFLQMFVMVK